MINLLVALPTEAKPLSQHLGLKRCQPDGAFPIYRGGNIQLVLSGPGSENATKACHFLHNTGPDADYWINIGIAGHPSAEISQLFQANRVIDDETGAAWNLPTHPILQLPQANLITVNEPVEDYPENALYDMEAAGMIAALAADDRLEHTIVLKIVSDNHNNSTTQISGRLVKSLINNHLNTIDNLLNAINR